MCGIVGIVGAALDGAELPERLRRMAASVRHRGPDGHGTSITAHAALGHQRLSIVDLAGGAQPMTARDGDVVLVYNGELYNHEALRRELQAEGCQFSTRSDTEVVLNAYLRYGRDCSRRLRGMFAFAIWDARQRTLFMSRDRLGIKPLFYAKIGQTLLFASEIKALLASGLIERTLDLQALDDYFAFGFIRSPRSIYRGIRSLLPGQNLAVTLGDDGLDLSFETFWTLPRAAEHEQLSYEDAQDELRRKIGEAVALHLVSDVPLGVFLSGGIDSSAVVWAVASAQSRPVQTFSIGFEAKSHDESEYARAVSRHFGTEHHEEIVRPDAISALPEVVHDFDEPFGDPSAIPTWYLCKMARRHVTVCLSGDGGDELFAGYRRYATVSREWAGRDARRLNLAALGGWIALRESRWANRVERLGMASFPAYYSRFRNNYSPRMRERLYSKDVAAQIDLEDTQDLYQRLAAEKGAAPLVTAQLADWQGYLSDDILVKLDRTSMAHSLEARVPLLDHELVSFVQGLPSKYKLQGDRTKAILKDMLAPHLPAHVLSRPKRGFAVPLSKWFRAELSERLAAVVKGPTVTQSGLFRPEYVERLYRLHRVGVVDLSFQLWQLLIFDEWYRSHSRPS